MRRLVAVAPTEAFARRDQPGPHGPALVRAFAALFHPALLAEAPELPALVPLDTVTADDETLFVLADGVAPSAVDAKQAWPDAAIPSDPCSPAAILHQQGFLNTGSDLIADFLALGYATLGMEVLFDAVGQDNPADAWTLHHEATTAARHWRDGDHAQAKESLKAAFEALANGRQYVFAMSVHWVELALWSPQVTEQTVRDRLAEKAPFGVVMTAAEIEGAAARCPAALKLLRDGWDYSEVEPCGGAADDRPWTILPDSARHWQLDRCDAVWRQHFGRPPDTFAARRLALGPDLPQLLMKWGYRHAIHAAFDGSRLPVTKSPKWNWTAGDGSVVEALARLPEDGTGDDNALAVFARLAATLRDDTSPVLPLARWLHASPGWLRLLHRTLPYAQVFGRFVTPSDYFLHSSYPDSSVTTWRDEYGAANGAVAGRLLGLNDSHEVRGRFDAGRAAAGIALAVCREPPEPLVEVSAVEDRHERDAGGGTVFKKMDHSGFPGGWAFDAVANAVVASAPPSAGLLVVNPCSFPCRTHATANGFTDAAALDAMPNVRGWWYETFPYPETVAIVDVPGWGFAWLPAAQPGQTGPKSPPKPLGRMAKADKIASGRKLVNAWLAAEVDPTTGGLRAVGSPQGKYSRLSARLSAGDGTTMVGAISNTTDRGPYQGSVSSKGTLRAADGVTALAKFEFYASLHRDQPRLGMALSLSEVVPGTPVVLEWSWPDERAELFAADGFRFRRCDAEQFETAHGFEVRERNLRTLVVAPQLTTYRRLGKRRLTAALPVGDDGDATVSFTVSLDLPRPWRAIQEQLQRAPATPVDRGPPAGGATGWLLKLESPDVCCVGVLPEPGDPPRLRLRLMEMAGQHVRTGLRFCRDPVAARLTNGRGERVYDLTVVGDRVEVDFAPRELVQVEVFFDRPSRPEEEDGGGGDDDGPATDIAADDPYTYREGD